MTVTVTLPLRSIGVGGELHHRLGTAGDRHVHVAHVVEPGDVRRSGGEYGGGGGRDQAGGGGGVLLSRLGSGPGGRRAPAPDGVGPVSAEGADGAGAEDPGEAVAGLMKSESGKATARPRWGWRSDALGVGVGEGGPGRQTQARMHPWPASGAAIACCAPVTPTRAAARTTGSAATVSSRLTKPPPTRCPPRVDGSGAGPCRRRRYGDQAYPSAPPTMASSMPMKKPPRLEAGNDAIPRMIRDPRRTSGARG